MGLDTSHDCWHGGYIAFNIWRSKLAEVVGIPLELMEGFYDGELAEIANAIEKDFRAPGIADSMRRWERVLPISWDILKPDVLHILLDHSDCEGDIPADKCAALADRLSEILPLLPDEDSGARHIGLWRDKTQKFIDGLRMAASLNEPVEFH